MSSFAVRSAPSHSVDANEGGAYIESMAVQLSPDTEQRLENLAFATARSADELAQEGLDRFLAYRESLEDQVKTGRAAAARGELIDHEEAMALMDKIVEHG